MSKDITKIIVNDTFEKAKADIIYLEKQDKPIEIDLYEIDDTVGFIKWLIVTGRLYDINNNIIEENLRREIDSSISIYWTI